MQAVYRSQSILSTSLCDDRGRLSLPGLFTLFLDMASVHGDMIGVGGEAMEARGLMWLVARTRVRIHAMPPLLSHVEAATWPEPPGRLRCHRCYTLHGDGALLAEGRSEWIMLERATGRPARAEVFPADFAYSPETACPEPFARIDEDFSACEELGEYTVRSTDIDVSRHMNNVAYVRAVCGAISCTELAAMDIAGAEAAYRIQCYEGERLSIRRRPFPGGHDYGIIKEDGRTGAVLRIALRRPDADA